MRRIYVYMVSLMLVRAKDAIIVIKLTFSDDFDTLEWVRVSKSQNEINHSAKSIRSGQPTMSDTIQNHQNALRSNKESIKLKQLTEAETSKIAGIQRIVMRNQSNWVD